MAEVLPLTSTELTLTFADWEPRDSPIEQEALFASKSAVMAKDAKIEELEAKNAAFEEERARIKA